jgi:hypothetical protein
VSLRFSKPLNYYEQSKAVAVVKEDMEVSDRKSRVSRIQAATKRLEEKLKIQDAIQEKSDNVLKKEAISNLNFKVAVTQSEVGSKR